MEYAAVLDAVPQHLPQLPEHRLRLAETRHGNARGDGQEREVIPDKDIQASRVIIGHIISTIRVRDLAGQVDFYLGFPQREGFSTISPIFSANSDRIEPTVKQPNKSK